MNQKHSSFKVDKGQSRSFQCAEWTRKNDDLTIYMTKHTKAIAIFSCGDEVAFIQINTLPAIYGFALP